jgi:glutaredoxin-like protein NrdH
MYVTIYTQPNCSQCEQTKRFLTLKNVEFTTVDITEDQDGYDFVTALGYKSVPVVSVSDGDVWSGFRLDKLNKLVEDFHG